MLDLSEGPRPSSARGGAARPARSLRSRSRGSRFATRRARETCCDDVDLELEPGRDGRARRAERGREEHARSRCSSGFAEPTAGRILVGGVDLASSTRSPGGARSRWVPQRPTLFSGDGRRQHPPWDPAADDERVRAAARLAGADASSRRFPTGTRRSSGTAAGRCRPAQRRASRSRGRSCATRRSSSSTSRPPISIRRAQRSSATRIERLRDGQDRARSSRTGRSSLRG